MWWWIPILFLFGCCGNDCGREERFERRDFIGAGHSNELNSDYTIMHRYRQDPCHEHHEHHEDDED